MSASTRASVLFLFGVEASRRLKSGYPLSPWVPGTLSMPQLSASCLPSRSNIQGQAKHKGFPTRVTWLPAHTHWPQDPHWQSARIPTSHPVNEIPFSEITSFGCLLGHMLLLKKKIKNELLIEYEACKKLASEAAPRSLLAPAFGLYRQVSVQLFCPVETSMGLQVVPLGLSHHGES